MNIVFNIILLPVLYFNTLHVRCVAEPRVVAFAKLKYLLQFDLYNITCNIYICVFMVFMFSVFGVISPKYNMCSVLRQNYDLMFIGS